MFNRRKVVSALAVAGMAVAATLVNASPAAAAYPTCNSRVQKYMDNGSLGFIPSAGYDSKCNMRQGNSGTGVRLLQNALNRCGYGDPAQQSWYPLQTDGAFGPKTYQAVLYNQSMIHIAFNNTVDGIYGPIWDRDSFSWPTGPGVGPQSLPTGPCTLTGWPMGLPVEG